MKIALFCDAYKPTRNGVAVSASTTAEELRRRGHEVTVFAPHYRGYQETDETVVRFPAMQWFRAKDFALALPVLSSPLVLPLLQRFRPMRRLLARRRLLFRRSRSRTMPRMKTSRQPAMRMARSRKPANRSPSPVLVSACPTSNHSSRPLRSTSARFASATSPTSPTR